jgi:hypothetical protein
MGVKEFTFDPSLTDAFVAFGEELYRDDAAWVPPLAAEVRRQLDPSFAFYGRPGHDHRRFLAFAGGRPVARAMASVHPGLRDRDGTPVGAVGFFESTPDDGAAGEVLAAAVDWLGSRGLRRIWGPLQFDIWHGYRFKTRGFDEERLLGEPDNKPYYPEQFARFGFTERRRWNSFPLDGPEGLEELATAGWEDYWRLKTRGYRFEPFDTEHFDESVATLHRVLGDSFSRFLGFTPVELDEFREVLGVARHAIEPRCSHFYYDEVGTLAGFGVALRDLAPAVRAMRGRSGLRARLAFLRRRRHARRLLLHLGGITRAESEKHTGLARAAVHHMLCRVRQAGYADVHATLVAGGSPMRRHYGPFASDRRREYTLFELGR